MVKYIVRGFERHGWCDLVPEIVYDLSWTRYVTTEKRVIPTGIDLAKFERPEITKNHIEDLRKKLAIDDLNYVVQACL